MKGGEGAEGALIVGGSFSEEGVEMVVGRVFSPTMSDELEIGVVGERVRLHQ